MKFFNIFFSIYRTILYAAIFLFVCGTILPMAGGVCPYVVQSASMEPEIMTGGVCYIKKENSKSPLADLVPYEEPQIGDIIAFQEGSGSDSVTVIHRLVGIDEKTGKYITKGDNNESNDLGLLDPDNVIGVYKYDIPKIGYFISWIQSKTGITTCAIFCGVALLSSLVTDVDDNKKNKRDNLPPENESHAGDEPREEADYIKNLNN